MRLLLDEMIGAVVAEGLRRRGHDVVAVQDASRSSWRGLDDCGLLALANDERQALVTDNVPDFVRCHKTIVEAGGFHHGLLFFGNESFPRHRHDIFVSRVLGALEQALRARPGDDATSWMQWLP